MRQARLLSLMALSLALVSTPVLACGYHNPIDVARGAMNFVYPKSLYVRTAVWQAQGSGVLPPRQKRPAKDLFAYHRTTAALRAWGRALGPAPDQGSSFSIVLLDTMLWSRYEFREGGLDAAIHVTGPAADETVLVTESAVIFALNDGTIDYNAAEARGLIRLYGPKDQMEKTRAFLRGLPAGAGASALHESRSGRLVR
ncbi:MAG: hypothetical protein AAF405_10240 [Pseudomonadota bacterium]